MFFFGGEAQQNECGWVGHKYYVKRSTAGLSGACQVPIVVTLKAVFKRVIWIVLDSVGVGAMPDAASIYHDDPASDTLGNIDGLRPLHLPVLGSLGLGNLKQLAGVPPAAQPLASFGKCALASPGKDTTTGHWEMVGIHLPKPFALFPNGFPREVMDPFEEKIARTAIGNKSASGTEVIQELGEEHMRTGSPIVYTSADSVFQIAAHEEVIPVWELYKICETARAILRGPFEVGRVIARPFIGTPGAFTRTANRHDYAVPPPKGMLLDQLDNARVPVFSVGKIFDVFLGRGIRDHVKTKSNADGMSQTSHLLNECERGLIFVNLVDFDQQYGHRNDVEGYAKALEEFDFWLGRFLPQLETTDLLLLCADHGCDPTTASTDHSREYTPLLAYNAAKPLGRDLGTRATLSDIGQTVAQNFGVKIENGTSFLQQIL